MKVTLHEVIPTPTPPPTVKIELTMDEASSLRYILGQRKALQLGFGAICHDGNVCYSTPTVVRIMSFCEKLHLALFDAKVLFKDLNNPSFL